MNDKLIALLAALDRRFPPSPGCHHSLTLGHHPASIPRVRLSISRAGRFENFILDDNDFAISPEQLCDSITYIMEAKEITS